MELRQALKIARAALGVAGAGIGILGILITIIAYLTIAPAVSSLGETTAGQIDSVDIALADAQNSVGSAAYAIDSVPAFADNASLALEGFGNSSEKLGGALASIGSTLEGVSSLLSIPQETIQTLKGGAGLSASASSMKKAAVELKGLGAKATGASGSMKKLESDIGDARTGIADAKESVAGFFDAAGKALLMGALALVLLFCGIIALSIAVAL